MGGTSLRGWFVARRVEEGLYAVELYADDVAFVGKDDTRHAFNIVKASNPVEALLSVIKDWLP